MSNDEPYGLTLTFDCPVCEDEVSMRETSQHNLKPQSEQHLPNLPWKDAEERCSVHFSRCERTIRDQYNFIRYEVPLVFTVIPETESNEDVLEVAIEGMTSQDLGVCVKVPVGNDRTGSVYAWYHSNQPLYYVVTSGIRTPQNVLATAEQDEVRSVLNKWFRWESNE